VRRKHQFISAAQVPRDVAPSPRRVYLYDDPSAATLDLNAVAAYLSKTTGIPATVRREFLRHHGAVDPESLAARIAATRVVDASRPHVPLAPLPPPLVHFERRLLENPERRVPGVLYDGFQLQAICRSVLPPKERTLDVAHVAFTSRLPGTFDDADRRYHARAIVLGAPALVSTSGLVEAPAKPRAFYAAKRGLRIESADARYEALKQEYAGRFVDYDDPRLTQIAKGYVLQAAFYLVTGEAFCEDPDCVLFNAHWQEEVLHAQVESGLLCARHRKVAEGLRGGRRSRPR